MATTVASLRAVLSADTGSFDRSMRGAEHRFRSTGREGGRFARGALAGSGIMRGFGRSIAFASGAFLGAAGFTALIRSAVDEYSKTAKVGAQTNAVIKSTGGVANVTAKHVEDLGKSLMNVSGIDDEVVKSGEDMLLTFTRIRNEAGKGNDVFDQATKASLDLSVAMKQDLKSSVIQVGKALNDPITGLTKLQRVGVTFSDAQVKLIKHLEATGHHLEAQKIILAELNKEFGGSAKAAGQTLPGQISILRESFKNFTGDLVAKTIPTLTTFVRFINRVRGAKNLTVAIKMIARGGGDVLSKLLFGSPATRVRVPIEGGRFEWQIKGGGKGLVGAIAAGIKDIDWVAIGREIKEGIEGHFPKLDFSKGLLAQHEGRKIAKGWVDDLNQGFKTNGIDPNKSLLGQVFPKGFGFLDAHTVPFGPNGMDIIKGTFGKLQGTAGAATRRVQGDFANTSHSAADTRAHVDLVRKAINALKSKKVTISAIGNGLSYVSELKQELQGLKGLSVQVTGGGKTGGSAGGQANWKGGLTWVGEQGKELVNLPRGSQVFPHRQSMAMASGNGGTTINNIYGPILERDLLSLFKKLDAQDKRRGG
jgi:hypothetical protein